MRIRSAALAVALAVLPSLALAPQAHASDGWVYASVYYNNDTQEWDNADDPGGTVNAYLNFVSRREVRVQDVTLDDVCPGDGKKVYWQLGVRMTNDKSWYQAEHYSSGDCDSANETWNSLTFTTDLYQVKEAWVRVCIDFVFEKCRTSWVRDNPYT